MLTIKESPGFPGETGEFYAFPDDYGGCSMRMTWDSFIKKEEL